MYNCNVYIFVGGRRTNERSPAVFGKNKKDLTEEIFSMHKRCAPDGPVM